METEATPFFWETVSEEMRQLMQVFSRTKIGKNFYLAGGSALAIQLGHRRSIDLDYFSPSEDIPSIREPLRDAFGSFNPILADTSWGNLVFLANGVRVRFYGYGFPLVAPLREIEGTNLASIPDIGLMKLDALQSRTSRKDFYDLYAIAQTISLRKLLNFAPKKYANSRDFESQVVKRFSFFERAENEADPLLLTDISWEEVKSFFRQQAVALSKDWF